MPRQENVTLQGTGTTVFVTFKILNSDGHNIKYRWNGKTNDNLAAWSCKNAWIEYPNRDTLVGTHDILAQPKSSVIGESIVDIYLSQDSDSHEIVRVHGDLNTNMKNSSTITGSGSWNSGITDEDPEE